MVMLHLPPFYFSSCPLPPFPPPPLWYFPCTFPHPRPAPNAKKMVMVVMVVVVVDQCFIISLFWGCGGGVAVGGC